MRIFVNNLKLACLASTMVLSLGAKNAIDLTPYLTGKMVDAQGRTLLHVLAANIHNDDLTVKVKLFDLLENKLPQEIPGWGEKIEKLVALDNISSELAKIAFLQDLARFVFTQDAEGKTALEILEQSPDCPRKERIMELQKNNAE